MHKIKIAVLRWPSRNFLKIQCFEVSKSGSQGEGGSQADNSNTRKVEADLEFVVSLDNIGRFFVPKN